MAGGGWLSCSSPWNSIREPLNHILMNSPVISDPEWRIVSAPPAGSCQFGYLKFYSQGCKWLKKAWNEAYSSSVCFSSYHILIECCHSFLIWTSCFAWDQACCSLKNIIYFKIMQESCFFFPLSLACHFNFPIAMVFHHNCFSSFWNSHLFYEFFGKKKTIAFLD